ncbi:MAG: lysozyme inhibitor LprI family protein [Bacteroidota bacterium]
MTRRACTHLCALGLLAALCAYPTTAAQGIEAEIEVAYDQCVEEYTAQSGSSLAPLIDCRAEQYDRWDAALNEVYQSLRRALDDDARTALRDAQRAWLAFRDVEFELLDATWGDEGMIGAVLIAEHRVLLVQERWHHLTTMRDEVVQD